MKLKRRQRRTRPDQHLRSSPAVVEYLENRTLLAAVTQAIQIDGQSPDVLGEYGDVRLLTVEDADSTRLFHTDGSQTGTIELADLPGSVDESDIVGTLDNRILIRVSSNDTLWITDGTAAGTLQLAAIELPTFSLEGAEFNSEFYFSADGGDGFEVWKTDGTAAGTVQVRDINTGQSGPTGSVLSWDPVPNAVSYSLRIDAYTDCQIQAGNLECRQTTVESHENITDTYVEVTTGGELMFLFAHFADGSRSSAIPIRNGLGRTDDVSSWPSDFAVYNGELYFSASTRDIGREIWKTDGTTAGTTLAVDVTPGPASTGPQSFLEFDGQLFFGAWGSNDLYRTDGTAAGTQRVLQGDGVTRHSVAGSFPIAVVNNRLIAQQMGNGGSSTLRRLVSLDSATDTTPTDLGVQGSGDGRGSSERWFDGFLVLNDRLLFRHVNRDTGSSSAVANAGYLLATDGVTAERLSNRLLWNEVHGPKHGVIDSLEVFGSVQNDNLYFTTDLEREFLDGVPVRTAAYRTDGRTLTVLSEDAAPMSGGVIFPHGFRQYDVVNGQAYYLSGTSPDSSGSPRQNLHRVNPSGEDFVLATNLRAGSMLEINDQLFLDLPTDNGSALFSVTEQAFTDTIKVTGGIGSQTGGTPTFTWDSAGANVRRYELYINPVGARSTASYRRSDLTTTSHTPATALADGEYEVWLRVHFEDGARSRWGGAGERLVVSTGQAPSTTPPEITAPVAVNTSRRPEISWTTISGATRYELWVSTATDVTPVIHRTDLTTTKFTPESDLAPGQYRIWVRAHRSNSRTKWTPTFRTEILHDVITITGGTGEQETLTPTITWSEAANVARYDLYINEIGVSTPAYRRSTLTGGSHTLETAMDPSKDYQVWIRAHFNGGSRTRWGTAQALSVIDGSFREIVPVLTLTGTQATWSAVEGAMKYQVWVNDIRPDGTMIHFGGDKRIVTTDTSVEFNYSSGRYRVWVQAFNSEYTTSAWSNSVVLTITANSDEDAEPAGLHLSLAALVEPEQADVRNTEENEPADAVVQNPASEKTDTDFPEAEKLSAADYPIDLAHLDQLMMGYEVFQGRTNLHSIRSSP